MSFNKFAAQYLVILHADAAPNSEYLLIRYSLAIKIRPAAIVNVFVRCFFILSVCIWFSQHSLREATGFPGRILGSSHLGRLSGSLWRFCICEGCAPPGGKPSVNYVVPASSFSSPPLQVMVRHPHTLPSDCLGGRAASALFVTILYSVLLGFLMFDNFFVVVDLFFVTFLLRVNSKIILKF